MNQAAASTTPSSSNVSFASKGDHTLTQEGSLKTQVGTLLFSYECPDESMESSLRLMQMICSQTISSSAQQGLSSSKPLEQKVIFLSEEAVSLEIEVKDLLLDLQDMDSRDHLTEAKRDRVESQKYTCSRSTTSLRTSLQENTEVSKSSSSYRPSTEKCHANQQQKSVASNKQLVSFPPSTKAASIKTHAPYPQRDVNINKHLLSERNALSLQRNSASDELLQTKKATYFQELGDQQEGSSQQQEHKRNSDQQEEESSKEDTANEKPTAVEGKSTDQALGIQSLLFHYTKNSSSHTRASVSPHFQKKAGSPMSIFSATLTATIKKPTEEDSYSGNVFFRFMQLMARILGQAEAEAHELYLKIKARTDDVETLTLLISKINASKGDIDWSKDTEMISLVNKAKQLGVIVPNENMKWNEEEKKMFRENIQMRKENMEKITQLERTDMQRLLQEVSQCHQARSNVLKLLKELMDTFIYNLRP